MWQRHFIGKHYKHVLLRDEIWDWTLFLLFGLRPAVVCECCFSCCWLCADKKTMETKQSSFQWTIPHKFSLLFPSSSSSLTQEGLEAKRTWQEKTEQVCRLKRCVCCCISLFLFIFFFILALDENSTFFAFITTKWKITTRLIMGVYFPTLMNTSHKQWLQRANTDSVKCCRAGGRSIRASLSSYRGEVMRTGGGN